MQEQHIELREIEADYNAGDRDNPNTKPDHTKSWPVLDSDYSTSRQSQAQEPATSAQPSAMQSKCGSVWSHKRSTSF